MDLRNTSLRMDSVFAPGSTMNLAVLFCSKSETWNSTSININDNLGAFVVVFLVPKCFFEALSECAF